jgi:hypothetical protein
MARWTHASSTSAALRAVCDLVSRWPVIGGSELSGGEAETGGTPAELNSDETSFLDVSGVEKTAGCGRKVEV